MNLRITNSNQNFVIGFNKIKGAFLYQNPNPDFLCKNGRIFRFFTKIQKRIIDPNDPQWRWILWIISKTGYFGYMIRSVPLLRIRKEWIQPVVRSKQFYYTQQLFDNPAHIFTAIFEHEAWIKRLILSVLAGW